MSVEIQGNIFEKKKFQFEIRGKNREEFYTCISRIPCLAPLREILDKDRGTVWA
jgi:hypothetical protein